ncbi:hypothetical protein NEF87_001427 [Candidatus Lokiarchaeum ossiferum]|uniref:Uncharacterized protein n=1 Tax=Candidatus Lokiarchaeum ossiferum TaxID=2951803 RepID=A0ABY6HRX6_9ARCH|nr:hypothetical protein NEF87_001427 [Candidatus Lokiarchaeum sp. B-35]
MSQPTQPLFCTDCGNQLTSEQYTNLMNGKSVYCEKCGKKFQMQTIHISSSNNSNKEQVFSDLGLNLKKGSKKLGEGTKKIWKGTKRIGSGIKKKIQDSKLSSPSGHSEASPNKKSSNQNSSPRATTASSPRKSPYNSRSDSNYRNEYRRPRMSIFHNDMDAPPLSQKYSYFRRMNLITSTLTMIHLLIYGIIILMSTIPDLQSGDSSTYQSDLLRALIPVGVGIIIFLYDVVWVRKKIESRDLQNYGIDFIIIGILGSIFGKGVGIYLAFKGFIVMFIAITDSAVFSWKYKRSFGDVILSLTNIFASLLGFIILGFTNPYFISLDEIGLIYFFIALGALSIDLVILRSIAKNRRMQDIPLWLGILKLVFGVMACFHFLSGIILVLEGAIITLVALFKNN